jgi:recombination protein RecT
MTQLVPMKERGENLRDALERIKPQMMQALPKHIGAAQMIRAAMTSIQRNPKLLECTPSSFLAAMLESSIIGLKPDGVLGQAWLIPYYNSERKVYEVHFQAGYKGLLDLARRSGEIESVEARVIYAGDKFEYAFGLEPRLVHVPNPKADRTDESITHFYAVVRIRGGGIQWDVMSAEEVDDHRKRYSRAKKDSPWDTAYPAMGCKTVLIRVLKLCPVSTELQRVIALSEKDDIGLPQDLEIEVAPTIEVEDRVDPSTGEVVDAPTQEEPAHDLPADEPPPPGEADAPAESFRGGAASQEQSRDKMMFAKTVQALIRNGKRAWLDRSHKKFEETFGRKIVDWRGGGMDNAEHDASALDRALLAVSGSDRRIYQANLRKITEFVPGSRTK